MVLWTCKNKAKTVWTSVGVLNELVFLSSFSTTVVSGKRVTLTRFAVTQTRYSLLCQYMTLARGHKVMSDMSCVGTSVCYFRSRSVGRMSFYFYQMDYTRIYTFYFCGRFYQTCMFLFIGFITVSIYGYYFFHSFYCFVS